MELWIRSQDKRNLVKCNGSVNATNFNINTIVINTNEQFKQESCKIFVDNLAVGMYSSTKRAVEILDDIQDKLNIRHSDNCGAEFIILNEVVPMIYEMPEE